jgi:hypothetical protein
VCVYRVIQEEVRAYRMIQEEVCVYIQGDSGGSILWEVIVSTIMSKKFI